MSDAQGPQPEAALSERVRARFVVEESVVSEFRNAEPATMEERFVRWSKESGRPPRKPEYLLPRVVRNIQAELPAFMIEPRDRLGRSRSELEDHVSRLAPWSVPFRLAHGVMTMPKDDLVRIVASSRITYRRDLIIGTLAELLGHDLTNTSVLDIGCSCGYFSLDTAARGALHVDGLDLRTKNVEQARFLAAHYGIDNVEFTVSDAADFEPGRQWDVVLNLGVLYHVTEPVHFLRQTFELCRRFAIIDTNCHREPVSAFMLKGDKDVERLTEGRESLEFLPTYRAAIDVIRYAGFSEVFEVLGSAEKPHKAYADGRRRCFLALK